ncbi:MAG: hypothetical protein ACR2JV_04085 [Gaiellales bacterium]
MAQSVQIPGTQQTAKICNVVGVAVLSFFFSLIYLWIFWYRINKEMAAYGQAKNTDECGTSPGKSLLAVTLGALIIVPALISFFRTHKRIVATQQLAGVTPINGWISLILYLVFSPAWLAYMQSGLNGVWESGGGAASAPAAAITEATSAAPAVDTTPAAEGEQA